MLKPGDTLHGYAIEALLGEGGFGAVYQARHRLLGTNVAIKEPKKEPIAQSSQLISQFEREARTLAHLEHPVLPKVSDYFEEQGNYYLVMEYIPGESLAEYLQRRAGASISEREALQLIAPLLDALDYLHGQNPPVIHRDIKPGNIRLKPVTTEQANHQQYQVKLEDQWYRVYLVDFGLAKTYNSNSSTTTGVPAVTEGFSPLEQYGSGTTEPRSDLYALGATLYALLSGTKPPPAPMRAVNDTLVPLRRQNPTVSPQLDAAIMKLLAIHAGSRYQNSAELRRDLQSLRESPAQPSPRPWTFPLLIGAIVVLLLIGGGSFLAAFGVFAPERQAAQAVPSLAASSQAPLPTAPQPTVPPTLTPLPATATVQVAETAVAAALGAAEIVYGPDNGAFVHDDDGNIERSCPSIPALRDFLVEAEFTNPYATAQGFWSYGFRFRSTDVNQEYRLYVRSNQTFYLDLYDGSTAPVANVNEKAPNLDISANGNNRLRLVVMGKNAYFFVNDAYVATLDVSRKLDAGSICIATGLRVGDERTGEKTVYENFTIRAPNAEIQRVNATVTAAAPTQAAMQTATAQTRFAVQSATTQALNQPAQQLLQQEAQWTTVLTETFDTNSRNWGVGNINDDTYIKGTREIISGTYQWEVTALGDNVFWRNLAPLDGTATRVISATNLSVAVNTRLLNNPGGTCAYGVVLRYSNDDDGTYYVFRISDSRGYRFSKHSQGRWETLIDWTPAPPNVIKPGEVNTLKVIVTGSQFWFYINGAFVTGYDDTQAPLTQGSVGLTAWLDKKGDTASVEFDNFEVRVQPPGP